MKIRDMLAGNRFDLLTELVEKETMMQGSESMLRKECKDWKKMDARWSNESWMCWLKIQAMKAFFGHDYTHQHSDPRVVTAVFHVFFAHLDETEDMLVLLRAEDAGKGKEYHEARSRIVSTNLVIRPINRVADRVTGGMLSAATDRQEGHA